jgi:hypothetical protein
MVLRATHPPIQWVPGALSLAVKQLGCKADHSPPSTAKVKNAWSYSYTPQCLPMEQYLVKHRENFTFYSIKISVNYIQKFRKARKGSKMG